MELRIDFYSAQEVSVQMALAKGNPYPAEATNELFVFTCFALRQFSNLGRNPVGLLLALILTTFNKGTAIKLAQDEYEFPGPASLRYLESSSRVKIGIEYDMLKDQIMPGLPKLVDFHSNAKRGFVMTVPPLQLQLRGFGLLGLQINYYAFHATIAVFRQLTQKHISDEPYLDRLSNMAIYCGRLRISRGIPFGDQAALAKAIFSEVGIV